MVAVELDVIIPQAVFGFPTPAARTSTRSRTCTARASGPSPWPPPSSSPAANPGEWGTRSGRGRGSSPAGAPFPQSFWRGWASWLRPAGVHPLRQAEGRRGGLRGAPEGPQARYARGGQAGGRHGRGAPPALPPPPPARRRGRRPWRGCPRRLPPHGPPASESPVPSWPPPGSPARSWPLARAGVSTAVFERRDTLGGIVRHVIPAFRLAERMYTGWS